MSTIFAAKTFTNFKVLRVNYSLQHHNILPFPSTRSQNFPPELWKYTNDPKDMKGNKLVAKIHRFFISTVAILRMNKKTLKKHTQHDKPFVALSNNRPASKED